MFDISVFSKRLKELRERIGMTQTQLAEIIGVTPQTISSYENNKASKRIKMPTLDKVVAIAKELKTSLDYICGMEVQETSNRGISNYADAVFFLDELERVFSWSTLRVSRYDKEKHGSWPCRKVIEFMINDDELAESIEKKQKMKNLLSEDTIDEELYKTWVVGETEKLKAVEATDVLPF